jgi:hypothetical protein
LFTEDAYSIQVAKGKVTNRAVEMKSGAGGFWYQPIG